MFKRGLVFSTTPAEFCMEKYVAFTLGAAPQTCLTFCITEKDPAGRTLQAACKRLAPELLLLGRRPKPALLFLIAEKEGKKASPLGTYKTYFDTGVLQLPTVKQIKRLYNSVQNRFYKQVQKGAFNGKIAKRHKIKRCFSSLLLFYIFVMVYLYV